MKALSASESRERACPDAALDCDRRTSQPAEFVAHQDHIELNLIKKGSLTYLYGGIETQAGPGRVVAFWSAIPHQIVKATRDAEHFAMRVPLDWFLQCRLPESFTRCILDGQVLVEPQTSLQADLDMFERWFRDLRSPRPSTHRIVLLEVEARLLRFAETLPAQGPSSRTGHSTSPACEMANVYRIRQMLCFIAQNYTEQITLELVSKSIGLHPACTMNLFRKTLGTSFLRYVTRLRVSHAQQLLATSNRKIIDVALGSGFNSLSRFNEVFKRECGCSPCGYRERCCKPGLN